MMNATTAVDAATMTAKLAAFVAAAQAMVSAYYAAHSPNQGQALTVEMGKRYAKVVTATTGAGCGRSVYCFVDMTNGDILKAASWKAPAKGARGSILGDNPLSAVRVHGARYYR